MKIIKNKLAALGMFALLSIALLSILVGLSARIRTKQAMVTIQTTGIDSLGIRLEAPYGSSSVQHALIVNDSSNYIFACDLEFEFTLHDGRVSTANKVVAFGDLLEADSSTLPRLLKINPGIAPHSKMILGLGTEPDMYRVEGKIPPIGESLTEGKGDPLLEVKQVIIRLNAVVLDDGRTVGPTAEKFSRQIKEVLAEEKKR